LGFRVLGLGGGFSLSAAVAFFAAVARLRGCFAIASSLFVSSGEPLRDCSGTPSVCSLSKFAKCSERTRLPTVANPLTAVCGIAAAREPDANAPYVVSRGLRGGERFTGDEGSIATRRVEAAWRGEVEAYTSGAGGEELSMTIEYSFPAICCSRKSLQNSR
jgi:hypothetical protein